MNVKEMLLASQFMEEFRSRLGNDGCNDWEFPEDWTHDEKVLFVKEYHAWNGDSENFNEDHLFMPNNAVAAFLAHKLSRSANVSR